MSDNSIATTINDAILLQGWKVMDDTESRFGVFPTEVPFNDVVVAIEAVLSDKLQPMRDSLKAAKAEAETAVMWRNRLASILWKWPHAETLAGEFSQAEKDYILRVGTIYDFAVWALQQLEGDSGAGANHWEQFPQYVAFRKLIDNEPKPPAA